MSTSLLPLAAAGLLAALAFAAPAGALEPDAAALNLRHAMLRAQLASNPFGRPLYLQSSERSGDMKGEVYAEIAQPFAEVEPALLRAEHWCDILTLHPNVKHCDAPASEAALILFIGRKFDQPLADSYRFAFQYRVAAAQPGYLRIELSAPDGPLGTRRYGIVLEAIALDARRSFLHFSYAYSQGVAARVATRLYLATVGRSKVGFSVVGHAPDGQPLYIGSTRGVVERNSMRCYLAVEAYLGARSAAAPAQLERRLSDWYAASERFPAQLHELGRAEYLDMKRREAGRAPGRSAVAAVQ